MGKTAERRQAIATSDGMRMNKKKNKKKDDFSFSSFVGTRNIKGETTQ
jgi:hypothetical protein